MPDIRKLSKKDKEKQARKIAERYFDVTIEENILDNPVVTQTLFDKIKPDFAWNKSKTKCTATIHLDVGSFSLTGENMIKAFWNAATPAIHTLEWQKTQAIIAFCERVREENGMKTYGSSDSSVFDDVRWVAANRKMMYD